MAEEFAADTRDLPFEVANELRLFSQAVRRDGLVLDAGCGTGRDMHALRVLGFDVYGIDISQRMLDLAQQSGIDQRSLRKLDLIDVASLGDNHFDGIWANDSLVHVPRDAQPAVVAGFHTVLKPGARLYMSLKRPPNSEVHSEWKTTRGVKRYFSYTTPTDAAEMLAVAGFELERLQVNETGERSFFHVHGVRPANTIEPERQ